MGKLACGGGQRFVQRWAVRTLTTLDFRELGNDALSALLGSRIGRRQALGCADHDQRPPLLVFRRRLHLISREIEGDLVVPGGSGRKVERVPINRDLAVANPQEAPKVDDRSTHLPALINDHVDEPNGDPKEYTQLPFTRKN